MDFLASFSYAFLIRFIMMKGTDSFTSWTVNFVSISHHSQAMCYLYLIVYPQV